jgi:hypothetical protein
MTDKSVDENWKRRVQSEKAQEEEAPPAAPPPDFLGLVTMLASEALVGLGAVPHPATGKPEPNLDHAQMIIGLLEMLEAKTKGNLTPEEDSGLKTVLSELRLAFVRATSEPRT